MQRHGLHVCGGNYGGEAIGRILVVLAVLLVLPSSAWAACGGASPTWTAASAKVADVSACVTAASSGDTIIVPAGTETWTTGLTVTGKQHDQRQWRERGDAAGTKPFAPLRLRLTWGMPAAIAITATATNFVDISGFKLIAGHDNPYGSSVQVSGTMFDVAYRIHDCYFWDNGFHPGRHLIVVGVYGLIDHNFQRGQYELDPNVVDVGVRVGVRRGIYPMDATP